MIAEDARPVSIVIASEVDIVFARGHGRMMAERLGSTSTDATMIATAISEIARNMLTYAGAGEMTVRALEVGGRAVIEVVARDEGPGIADVDRALREGYSTGEGIGLGLPGARRLMDEFEVRSEVGAGTTVVMRKVCAEVHG